MESLDPVYRVWEIEKGVRYKCNNIDMGKGVTVLKDGNNDFLILDNQGYYLSILSRMYTLHEIIQMRFEEIHLFRPLSELYVLGINEARLKYEIVNEMLAYLDKQGCKDDLKSKIRKLAEEPHPLNVIVDYATRCISYQISKKLFTTSVWVID